MGVMVSQVKPSDYQITPYVNNFQTLNNPGMAGSWQPEGASKS